MKSLIFAFIVCYVSISAKSENENLSNTVDLSRGFGKNINWVKFDDAFKVSEQTNKPIFLLIHKSWCGACKKLKESLNSSDSFQEASKSFVMVNVEDNEEPNDEKYKKDADYVPRIFFMNRNGQINYDLYNQKGNPKYKYYYYTDKSLIETMKKAIEYFENQPFEEKSNVQTEDSKEIFDVDFDEDEKNLQDDL